jgi:hypothetical protein
MEIFLAWLLSSILSAAVLSRYNKAGTGFLLGLFLGPFGLLFALVMRSGESKKEDQKRHDEQMIAMAELKSGQESTRPERECPYCAENILAKAKVCKHCGKDVEPIGP